MPKFKVGDIIVHEEKRDSKYLIIAIDQSLYIMKNLSTGVQYWEEIYAVDEEGIYSPDTLFNQDIAEILNEKV